MQVHVSCDRVRVRRVQVQRTMKSAIVTPMTIKLIDMSDVGKRPMQAATHRERSADVGRILVKCSLIKTLHDMCTHRPPT